MGVSSWLDEALGRSAADGCIVVVTETNQLNLRWAANGLTTNGQMTARTATVISVIGARPASVSGPVTGAADLAALVSRADAAAVGAPEAQDASPLVEGGREDGFDEPADEVPAVAFGPLCAALGEAFVAAAAEGHLLFGFAEYHRATTWLGVSTGLRRRFGQPMGRFEFTAKSPDLVNSAWVGQATNDFTDVDVAAHHAELRRRLGWGERRVSLPAGAYETILSPGAVVDLLLPMSWELSARDATEGRTCFAGKDLGSTRVGERLSSLPVTMASDPAAPGLPVAPFAVVEQAAPGTTSVFDNGAEVGRIEWITDGTLASLMASRADARALGLPGLRFPTENLLVDAGGTRTIDELVAATTRGLLVTCLWYIRTVDPQTLLLTGLTRDGVYLIEDGEVVGLVNNFRFNESPLDLLRRATEASVAEPCLCREWNDWFTRSIAPALRIPDFRMSTVSQAY